METVQEFTQRCRKLTAEAMRLSLRYSDDMSELNGWMMQAKRRGMTWVEGLEFAIEQMRAPVN